MVQKFLNISCFFLIRRFEVDFVLLAGFLKLIPVELIRAYSRSIVNIHPSLLPAFGGKGYFGMKVHKAVIASGARYLLAVDVYISKLLLFPD
jgi:folate-dependent phosphoribosylglycinamide formyltransferase PurN